MPETRKTKIWLLADRRGWAYDELCQGVAAAVQGEFECRIAYVAESPDLSAWDFDLVLVCFWGETWHQQFVSGPEQVIKLLCSHRWQEPGYGCLSPGEFADTHLQDAATLGATSKRLQELLTAERAVHHTPEGVDVARFATSRTPRTNDQLSFGWVGNIDDACKGVRDLLQPAAQNMDLRIAGGDLDAAAMTAFYRDVDCVVVASSLEGQPRPLLEGMASGCYAISTDVGIAPELIQDTGNGMIVERSQASLRAAMHWCQVNAGLVRERGQDNADIVADTRTWQAVAASWLDLLRNACSEAGVDRAPTEQSPQRPAQASSLIDRCKQDYAAHLDKVHNDGPDQNSIAAAAAYYRNELMPLLPERRDARVLDVGCAYGLLLEFLHDQGYHDLTGVEIAPQLHRSAQSRMGERATIHLGDAAKWLADHVGEFDVITAYDILEHFPIEGAEAFAAAIRKALRPGGIAVFRTPNMANVLGIYSRYMDLTHQTGFTEQSASQLLRMAGFAKTELIVPDFSNEPQMANAVAESRRFHQQLFALQDRSMPRCFDKNIVVAAKVATVAAVPSLTRIQPAVGSLS